MAHTNDLMTAKLRTYYTLPNGYLGDLQHTFLAANPTFAPAVRRAWYAAALDALVVSYASDAHEGDLANLYWSQSGVPA